MSSEAAEASKPAGVLFNKYTLGRLLGRGTFAKVYEARPKSDPKTVVAIKAIDKSHVSDPAAAARVLREVSIMRRLRHPGVVALHEVMATKSKIYLVVEFAPGGDLHSLLARRGPLTEPAAFRCFHQLVSAVGFCHAGGVSHRDIKPHNILLDAEGNLKVTDFGLSALPENARDDGMLQTACGTPAFTAPEVVRRKGYDGRKADAWSCGVMLFVLLSGYLPYDDANLIVMYKKAMKREVVYPPWVTPQSRRLIHRLVDPNPTTRMTIQEVLELRWFKKYHQNYSQSLSSKNSIIGDHDPKVFGINAFDIISMSSGLDLSGLFEETKIPGSTRFISTQPLGKVVERAEEVGKTMGYEVRRGKWGDVIFLKSGEEIASVVVVTVAESMVMGGLKVRIEGFSCLDSLKGGFEDIVFAWQTNCT